MIEFIRSWIIQVLVTVIFMVLVDMILPNNNFKKYAKLATGLIVIITIITPVFKLFDRDINVQQKIQDYIVSYQEKESKIDTKKIQQDVNKKTVEVYREKLKKAIEQSIYNKTGKRYTVTEMEIVEDTGSYNFSEVKNINIMKKSDETNIKSVDKVVIGRDKVNNEAPIDKDVLKVLMSEYKIDSDAVKFVK